MNYSADRMTDMRVEKRVEVFNTVLRFLTVAGMGDFLIGMPEYCDDRWYIRMRRHSNIQQAVSAESI